MSPVDPYTLLGLEPGASRADIKKAWRRLARAHHPDLNPDDPNAADRFTAFKEAYDALMSGDASAAVAANEVMDADWLDVLEWMVEVRRRAVMTDFLPRFVGAYGTQSALVWALRRATNLEAAAQALPPSRPQWAVRRMALDIFVDDTPDAWRLARIVRQPNGRIALVLFARVLWQMRPPDEDGLRTLVFTAVDQGIAAAVPAALRREFVPATLEEARLQDRRENVERWFWRAVWGGIALLMLNMLRIMLTT